MPNKTQVINWAKTARRVLRFLILTGVGGVAGHYLGIADSLAGNLAEGSAAAGILAGALNLLKTKVPDKGLWKLLP